jgi:S-adenosylmethionine decarboxylase proenzyme
MLHWLYAVLICLAAVVVGATDDAVLSQDSPVVSEVGLDDCDDPADHKTHEFTGRHLLASYLGCQEGAIRDLAGLRAAMMQAVEASHATVLTHAEHVFAPDGLTMVVLLSESHASIHTYPEEGACFVDLFTCGNTCSAEAFDAVMRKFLRPSRVEARIITRGQETAGRCPHEHGACRQV